MALPKICTIGYEGAAIEDLIATLKSAGVTRLLDVREAPYSRREEFTTDTLAAALADFGIAYTHLRALGNPPPGREAARAGHAAAFREIFAAHLDGPEARRALAFAAAETVCLLCLEKAASHCHRGMVAARMHALSGQEIVNLKVQAKQPHPAQSAFDF
ncbi:MULTISPECIES: DUF488 domain-containing protein [Rhodomicrobium]|uniref:DUF488 domain-containing protein n=1 Tax=Rhodomicrobium TaxID=1068 RepID=UPI001AECFC3F|nr:MULTISPECIES: DUF488 domain-containing protein [Rhodomicrobium]